jgi:hypothetical protein
LPILSGRPVRVEIRQDLGSHHAASSIPRRLILLDRGLLTDPREFDRILVHELFHFVWVRLSNRVRREWEQQLGREFRGKIAGELGWSAEWRKNDLRPGDVRSRSLRWRRYVCESFCDSAAWVYSEVARHPEFTLPPAPRCERRAWFHKHLPRHLPVRF